MKPRYQPALILPALLLLLISVYAARLVNHAWPAGWELGRTRLTRLDANTRERLRALEDRVLITYYVSAGRNMPSHMRGVEPGVRNLLEALRRAGRGRVQFEIVDPDLRPDLASFAARRQVAPVRVRHVSRDSYSERTVWSALTIDYGPRAPVVIDGIGPEYLPRLQEIIVETLDQMENSRPPVLALRAPPGFSELRAALSERGRVVEPGPARADDWLAEVDVLFWIEPERAGADDLRQLARFLERGGSAVIAGGRHDFRLTGEGENLQVAFEERGEAVETLLSPYGLRPLRHLVLDQNAAEVLLPEGVNREIPFLVRSSPYDQDFHSLPSEPNGHLSFSLPAPFDLDRERLAELGVDVEVLATTSGQTRVRPFPAGAVPLGSLTPESAEAAPKLPLMVLVRPAESWQGRLVAAASASPFADGMLSRPGFAHRRLLDVLIDSLAGDERLVFGRTGIHAPEPLPELTPASRFRWRTVAVLLFPALILAAGVLAGKFTGAGRAGVRRRTWRDVGFGAGAFLCVLLLVAGVGRLDARLDLTSERLNGLAPETRRLVRDLTGNNSVAGRDPVTRGLPVEVELVFSPMSGMPPEMRPQVRRLEGLLEAFRRAGAGLSWRYVRPGDLGAAQLEGLAARGVEPARMTSREEGGTTVRTVYSSVVLASGGRTEVLPFPDPVSFENLEFRLAFALRRLETGQQTRIGFASDVPRLTPAEAYEYYQTRGLFAPSGIDVYSLAREVLERNDFRVTHVDPADPALPEDIDALVWLQPRRRIDRLLEATVEYLHRGGNVLLAAQHFNMQSRQYPGSDYTTVYWPQPQFPELERLYFPALGIDLVREVFFDELNTRIDAESQIEGPNRREFRTMTSALPFVIRAAAANFAPDSVITRGLGDQAFIWGSYLRVDEGRLGELGIRAKPLIFSSPRTWSYDWDGGWLPGEVLDGPPETGGGPRWLGPQPLAMLFEGAFPRPAVPLSDEVGGEALPLEPVVDSGDASPGGLLFIGGSEMFKNDRLLGGGFRGDHLLLNAVAALALEDDLAGVMGRRREARGFDYVPPARRLAWRAAVVGVFPLVILLAALRAGLAGAAGIRLPEPRRDRNRLPAEGARGAGRPPVSPWRNRVVVLALLASVLVSWDIGLSRADYARRQVSSRIDWLVSPEERQEMQVAVVGVREGEGPVYYFARSGGVWRSLNFRNAPADAGAIERLATAILSARGAMHSNVPGRAGDYGIDGSSTWRVSLHGPRFGEDRETRDLLFDLDIGARMPGMEGSFVRPGPDAGIWAVDTDLRRELEAVRPEGMPPLLDPFVIPAAWPGPAGWRRVTVEPVGGAGFELELAIPPEGTGDAGPEWVLNSGESTQEIFQPAVMAYMVFLGRVPYREVLDLASLDDGTLGRPGARLAVFPAEGESLELLLAADRDGRGAVAINSRYDSAYLLDPDLVDRIFPSRETFLDPPVENPWPMPSAASVPVPR